MTDGVALDPDTRFFVAHMQKTAGTTLRDRLRSTFTEAQIYPNGTDGGSDRVSILAPVGSALLGLRVGQSIRWPAPGGSIDLRVLAIRYQPEAAGDLHR